MKKILIVMSLCFLCGCSSWIVRPEKIVLLPEERIFTIAAGQEIAVTLDGKPIKMTFPDDMKIVSPTLLVRQEEKLNNASLDKAKANKEKQTLFSIIAGIVGAIAASLGIFFKMKSWLPKVKANIEVK